MNAIKSSGLKRSTSISQTLRKISDEDVCSGNVGRSNKLVIRAIRTSAELEVIYRMTYDGYLEMGYIEPRPDGRFANHAHFDALSESTVLIALLDGRIVGTNSFTLDGPSGLMVDEDFKVETDRIRAEGQRISCSYRINTVKECRGRRDVVMELIRETTRLILASGVKTCLFIFNKRHERIYKKLLNMVTIASVSEMHGVNNCPVVFMRCNFENIPDWCLRPTRFIGYL